MASPTAIIRHPKLFADFDCLRDKSTLSPQEMKLQTAMAMAIEKCLST